MKRDVTAGVFLPPFWGAFVLISMEILSYMYTSCIMYSNKKHSNENLKSCLFNSANCMAVAFTVWKIGTVKNEVFCTIVCTRMSELFTETYQRI